MARVIPALVAIALLLAGCSRSTPPSPPVVVEPQPTPPAPDDGSIPPPRPVSSRTPDQALAFGVDYLLAQQSPDGAWRSDITTTFKDGTALTPLAITALQEAHDAGVRNPEVEAAIKKGLAWLAKLSKPDGTIDPGPDGLDFPIYTAALTTKALSHATGKEFVKHRDGWVKYLKERQLTEKLGWKPAEKQYGGWGYCRVIPKKPEPNVFAPNLIESNLSATVFALDALKSAGALDEKTAKIAAIFVRRCQNWPLLAPHESPFIWSRFIDGGFHFIYDDPTRNKAGVANDKPQVFHSYGSTTADGLRALRLCGQAEDDAREWGAIEWLLRYFRADTHPGNYVKSHEPNREAVYYYYAASVAKALREVDVTKAPWQRVGVDISLLDRKDWAAELAAELVKRQNKDGSWVNPVELVREHVPVVATCNALCALARCEK
jgi:hypothetical protein